MTAPEVVLSFVVGAIFLALFVIARRNRVRQEDEERKRKKRYGHLASLDEKFRKEYWSLTPAQATHEVLGIVIVRLMARQEFGLRLETGNPQVLEDFVERFLEYLIVAVEAMKHEPKEPKEEPKEEPKHNDYEVAPGQWLRLVKGDIGTISFKGDPKVCAALKSHFGGEVQGGWRIPIPSNSPEYDVQVLRFIQDRIHNQPQSD